MSKIHDIVEKITGDDGRAEADVEPDNARADARDIGGDENRTPQEGTTTGTGAGGEFVGRVGGDDNFSGETGAERRAGE
ncbi:hypothetical protein [Sporichthya sp.]|uniref:hypothetical protein n=1 Tax=Sporichthya sp. TaxID=65475 RepID=UPI0017D12030|nr:hypothetical protein [Sporichthya sp.]MBA3744231.1 hypothetical protein [Sporichthya sp.]